MGINRSLGRTNSEPESFGHNNKIINANVTSHVLVGSSAL